MNSGLVARLKELEPEFREIEEEADKKLAAVARPGFRKRARTAAGNQIRSRRSSTDRAPCFRHCWGLNNPSVWAGRLRVQVPPPYSFSPAGNR